MPTVRLEPDVYEALQKLAQPFVDSPSLVIRRLLESQGALKKVPPKSKGSHSPHALTPQSVFERYLLAILQKEFDGRGHKRDITHAIIKRMMRDGHISAADQELVSTGETKAENTITWARNALKSRGYISRTSPRGIWELTPRGKNASNSVDLS